MPQKNPAAGEIYRVWQEAVDIVLAPLKQIDPSVGLMVDCADGFRRQYFLIIAAWVADYQEHSIISQIKSGYCPVCEISSFNLSHDLTDADKEIKRAESRNQEVYKELADTDAGREKLMAKGVSSNQNIFWNYPMCNVYRLW